MRPLVWKDKTVTFDWSQYRPRRLDVKMLNPDLTAGGHVGSPYHIICLLRVAVGIVFQRERVGSLGSASIQLAAVHADTVWATET